LWGEECPRAQGRGHGDADKPFEGLSLPFPTMTLKGQAKAIYTVLEGLLKDHADVAM